MDGCTHGHGVILVMDRRRGTSKRVGASIRSANVFGGERRPEKSGCLGHRRCYGRVEIGWQRALRKRDANDVAVGSGISGEGWPFCRGVDKTGGERVAGTRAGDREDRDAPGRVIERGRLHRAA